MSEPLLSLRPGSAALLTFSHARHQMMSSVPTPVEPEHDRSSENRRLGRSRLPGAPPPPDGAIQARFARDRTAMVRDGPGALMLRRSGRCGPGSLV